MAPIIEKAINIHCSINVLSDKQGYLVMFQQRSLFDTKMLCVPTFSFSSQCFVLYTIYRVQFPLQVYSTQSYYTLHKTHLEQGTYHPSPPANQTHRSICPQCATAIQSSTLVPNAPPLTKPSNSTIVISVPHPQRHDGSSPVPFSRTSISLRLVMSVCFSTAGLMSCLLLSC
jgi:hypothetical protein